MQNRLDKALVKFNSTLADNAKIRETIDHLRSERIIFENIYKKLEKQLIDFKRKIGGVIEESTQAYDARYKLHITPILIAVTELFHISIRY